MIHLTLNPKQGIVTALMAPNTQCSHYIWLYHSCHESSQCIWCQKNIKMCPELIISLLLIIRDNISARQIDYFDWVLCVGIGCDVFLSRLRNLRLKFRQCLVWIQVLVIGWDWICDKYKQYLLLQWLVCSMIVGKTRNYLNGWHDSSTMQAQEFFSEDKLMHHHSLSKTDHYINGCLCWWAIIIY